MTLQNLTYFIATAKTLSFTKAAAQLFVSQPTLSRAINDMEKELGCALFERSGKGLQLTRPGAVCLDEAQKILRACNRMPVLAKAAQINVGGTVHIGYVVNGQIDLLLRHLDGFMDRFPNIVLESVYDTPSAIVARYLNGEIDLLLTVRANCEGIEGKRIFVLNPNSLCIMVLKGNPLFERTHVYLRELRDQRIVTTNPSQMPILCNTYTKMLNKVGITPNIVGSGEKLDDIKLQMLRHKAIAFTCMETAYMNSANLRVIPVADILPEHDSVAICQKDNRNSGLNVLTEHLRPLADDADDPDAE